MQIYINREHVLDCANYWTKREWSMIWDKVFNLTWGFLNYSPISILNWLHLTCHETRRVALSRAVRYLDLRNSPSPAAAPLSNNCAPPRVYLTCLLRVTRNSLSLRFVVVRLILGSRQTNFTIWTGVRSEHFSVCLSLREFKIKMHS